MAPMTAATNSNIAISVKTSLNTGDKIQYLTLNGLRVPWVSLYLNRHSLADNQAASNECLTALSIF
jgi:hypothetical protein